MTDSRLSRSLDTLTHGKMSSVHRPDMTELYRRYVDLLDAIRAGQVHPSGVLWLSDALLVTGHLSQDEKLKLVTILIGSYVEGELDEYAEADYRSTVNYLEENK
jgi:hypothetical protein